MVESSQGHIAWGEAGAVGIAAGTPTKAFVCGGTSRNLEDYMVSQIGNVEFLHDI